ncbi:hypothetical protein D779_2244 [Imhoffiella purpurea]|uniref:Uncharacterized protein n=1 Tax=Imhoffiella purpurea TaxID=1249627 RepID=W9VW85_9GAMM|nr:hypothetical protein D779_2244 [Imhoffiella purpurea]
MAIVVWRHGFTRLEDGRSAGPGGGDATTILASMAHYRLAVRARPNCDLDQWIVPYSTRAGRLRIRLRTSLSVDCPCQRNPWLDARRGAPHE